jgi:hypothetical protein
MSVYGTGSENQAANLGPFWFVRSGSFSGPFYHATLWLSVRLRNIVLAPSGLTPRPSVATSANTLAQDERMLREAGHAHRLRTMAHRASTLELRQCSLQE